MVTAESKMTTGTEKQSTSKQDIRQTFQWFKQHITQILEAYDRTVVNASSIEAAEIQIVAFGRLLILKLTETFPNLKEELIEPLKATI